MQFGRNSMLLPRVKGNKGGAWEGEGIRKMNTAGKVQGQEINKKMKLWCQQG